MTANPADAKSEFSHESLLKHWMEYAESLTVEKIHLKNTLVSCKPELKEDFTLDVPVYNPSQKEEITGNSAEILAYLCRKLDNAHIKMAVRIVEKGETDMVYTLTEKYDYLLKNYPRFEKLKRVFNLILE